MQQQYYTTVDWNPYIRNASFDAEEYVTLFQLTGGNLPTESYKYQMGCIMSVLDGPHTGLYSNSGTLQTPTWTSILVSPIIRISRVITDTEIKQLNTSPLELAAAPGAGKYIVPQQGFLKWVPGNLQYTQPGNTNIVMGNTSTNIFQFGNFLFGNTPTVRMYFPNNSALLTENAPLELYNTNADPSVGNGTFELILYYQIAVATL